MSITKSENGRRFDEEFNREVADLASKPSAGPGRTRRQDTLRKRADVELALRLN